MENARTTPRRMARHLIFQTDDPVVSNVQWSSAAQPATITVLGKPFFATVCGVSVGSGAVFWTEIAGTYRVRSIQLGNTFSLVWLLEGRGECRWHGSGEPSSLQPGSLMFTAPGVDFDYTVANPAGITAKVGLSSIDRIRLLSLPSQRRAELCGLVPDPDRTDLGRLLEFLVDEIDRKQWSPGAVPLQIASLMEVLVARTARIVQDRLGPLATASPSDVETVAQCDLAIAAHASPARTVAELVQRVPWSQRQIYRAFERVCDCTPTDYLRRVHLIQARGRLEFSPGEAPPLEEVAANSGYRSVRSFAADYRAEFGHLPGRLHP